MPAAWLVNHMAEQRRMEQLQEQQQELQRSDQARQHSAERVRPSNERGLPTQQVGPGVTMQDFLPTSQATIATGANGLTPSSQTSQQVKVFPPTTTAPRPNSQQTYK